MTRYGPLPDAPEEERLDQRVLTTLEGLSGRLAFSGLRRVLGSHPESLSRSLRRLQREGLVERTDDGYRAIHPAAGRGEPADREMRAIAAIDLPPGAPASTVLGRLAGRWFGTLRWVGVLERAEGQLLAWARRSGEGLVLLGLRRGVLRVYVPALRAGDDPAEAEEAAYELLFHAVETLRPSGHADALGPGAGIRAFDLVAGPLLRAN